MLHKTFIQLRNYKSKITHTIHQTSSLHCTSPYFTSLNFTTIYSPLFTSFMYKFSRKSEWKRNLGTLYWHRKLLQCARMRHTELRLNLDQLQAVPCIRQCYIGLRNVGRISWLAEKLQASPEGLSSLLWEVRPCNVSDLLLQAPRKCGHNGSYL